MTSLKRKTHRPRDLEKTRAHILQVAFLEVFQHGFQGVSVDDIVKKTELTKGAFYHHFPTKLDLGYALVDDVIKPMIIDRWIEPLKDSKDLLKDILNRIDILIGSADDKQLKLGCPLNNLVQEMSSQDKKFKERLEIALNLWISELESLIVIAKKNNQIKKSVNAKDLATFVVMAHEGFYGLLKGTSPKQIYPALFNNLKTYLTTLR